MFTAIPRKAVKVIYDQYTVPDTVAVKLLLLPSFSTLKHAFKASRAILRAKFL